jgi:hypothetical protein
LFNLSKQDILFFWWQWIFVTTHAQGILHLSYYQLLILPLSCNSSNTKRTLSLNDVVEEGEEGTIKPCVNTEKPKKPRWWFKFVHHTLKNTTDFIIHFIQPQRCSISKWGTRNNQGQLSAIIKIGTVLHTLKLPLRFWTITNHSSILQWCLNCTHNCLLQHLQFQKVILTIYLTQIPT